MIDEKQLAEIEERASRATPGPWVVDEGEAYEGDEFRHVDGWTDTGTEWMCLSKADAGFIAYARTDVPALCAALRHAWGERDEHRERANAAQIAWDTHKAMDCAIKCAHEIEELLGASDPVEAARWIREMVKECSDLHIENGRLEAQAAALRKALEWAEEYSTDGTVREMYREALRSDAGKALGEYVKLLERVLDLAYRYFDEAWKDRMDLKWSPSVELIGAIKAAKEAKP